MKMWKTIHFFGSFGKSIVSIYFNKNWKKKPEIIIEYNKEKKGKITFPWYSQWTSPNIFLSLFFLALHFKLLRAYRMSNEMSLRMRQIMNKSNLFFQLLEWIRCHFYDKRTCHWCISLPRYRWSLPYYSFLFLSRILQRSTKKKRKKK